MSESPAKLAELQDGQNYIQADASVVNGYLVHSDYSRNLEQETSLSIWTPISIPSSAFVSSGVFFDTEITSESYVHFLTGLILELNVINNNANAIKPVPTRFLIDRLEVFMGSNLLQQFYSHELWTYLLLSYYNEQLAVLSGEHTAAAIENFNNVTMGTTTNTIATTVTQKLAFVFPQNILNSSIFLPAVSGGRIKIRIYLAGGTSIYTTADNTGLALQGCRLYGMGYRLSPRIYPSVFNFYASNKVITKFAYSRQQVSTVTAIANSEFRIPLNSFLGSFSFMCFWARVSNPAGAQLYTNIPLQDWSLINSSGQPVYSSTNINQYVFSLIHAHKFPSFTQSITNGQMSLYNFSEAPFEALQKGVNLGNGFSNGLWTLRGTPTANNTLDIICVASELALCLQDAGNLVAMYL